MNSKLLRIRTWAVGYFLPALALVFAAALIPVSTASAVALRWVVPPYSQSSGGGGGIAEIVCQYEFGKHQTPRGSRGEWGQFYDFDCEGAGVIKTSDEGPSCDGVVWPGTLSSSPAQADIDCQTQDRNNNHDNKNNGNCCTKFGDPINPATGNEFHEETDFVGGGPNPVKFARAYNSRGPSGSAMGFFWRSTLDRSIALSTTSNAMVVMHRQDGKAFIFNLMKSGAAVPLTPYDPAAQWVGDADVSDRLTRNVDGSGNTLGWTYYVAATDEFESYDSAGRLTAIAERNGMAQTISYDSNGLLQAISDAFGRTFTVVNGAGGRVSSITDPAGNTYQYAYDSTADDVGTGNLLTVTYPGSVTRQFLYNEQTQTQGNALPYSLTGIIDELGARYATISYDAANRAVAVQLAGGADAYGAQYPAGGGSATVTDPLGASRDISFSVAIGTWRTTAVSQPCAWCGTGNASSVAYDANRNATSRIDFNGKQTCYSYDLSRNLETARVEGALSTESCGTVLTTLPSRTDVRKITTQWHPVWRLQTKVAEPNRITTSVYNGDIVSGSPVYCAPTTALVNGNPIGVLCSKTVQETSDSTGQQGFAATLTGASRSWSYTYDGYGQLLTQTDPNGKSTTRTYYAATDADVGKRGNLHTITNAVGHVTTFDSYDLNGRLLQTTDPNGVVTTLAYHPRGWLTSRAFGGETTTYDYFDSGQLRRVTLPDGSYVQYTYDAAHRLTQLQDGLGNKVVYTLDPAGNRIKEDAYDPSGQLARTAAHVYDSLGRLHQDVGAK